MKPNRMNHLIWSRNAFVHAMENVGLKDSKVTDYRSHAGAEDRTPAPPLASSSSTTMAAY
ncbi:MAG: hypothetical protein ABI162_02610 [Luteolibacter sp.]